MLRGAVEPLLNFFFELLNRLSMNSIIATAVLMLFASFAAAQPYATYPGTAQRIAFVLGPSAPTTGAVTVLDPDMQTTWVAYGTPTGISLCPT